MQYRKRKEPQTLGPKIRELRLSLGLTQEQLGERSGLHYSYVGQMERGDKIPSLRALTRLAAALNTTPEYLLDSQEDYLPQQLNEGLHRELLKLTAGRDAEDLKLLLHIAHLVLKRLDQVRRG